MPDLASLMRGTRPTAGVNVVGYFDRTSGLGERARVLVDVLRAGGVVVSEWPVDATVSPAHDPHGSGRASDVEHRTVHDTTIAVVTALEFPGLAHSHGGLVNDVDRLIGYWFWELADIPPTHADALSMVDEIWAPTSFVRDAYRRVAACPVRLVPLPIPPPRAVPNADGSRCVDDAPFCFLTSFDHLSVMERKNPLGVIEAFRRGFPTADEQVRLVIKSMNAEHAPDAHADLVEAASKDDRISVRDEHLSDDDHAALVASADAFVSLHRSEGLGLQPALAMWLGVPVVCSAYSGTLDLMDDSSALLIPVSSTPVIDGGGAYPPGSLWADPDLSAAADAFRRLASDRSLARAIGRAGRSRMENQPTLAEAGRAVRRVLRRSATGRRSFGSVVSDAGPDLNDRPVDRAMNPIRSVARAATSPIRGYMNNHFEMVKQEVRESAYVNPTIQVDDAAAWERVAELENTIAELSLYQTRTVTNMTDEVHDLTERVADLERVVRQLAAVIGASNDRPVQSPPE